MTTYPGSIDGYISLPLLVDSVSPIVAADHNRLRNTIVTIQQELGINPSGTSGTVAERINYLELGNLTVVDGDYGDITVSGAGTAFTVDVGAITNEKIRESVALSVIGRSGATDGYVADITSTATEGNILQVLSGALDFGKLTINSFVDGTVTLAKLANIGTDKILGRDTAGSGVIEELTLGSSLSFSGAGVIQRAALTGDVTASADSNATTIASGVVTNAKLSNVATATFKARSTAGTGSPEDLTVAQAKTLLAIAASDVSGLATIATSGSAGDLGTGTIPDARMPDLTGDITTTVGTVATTIASGVVTNAKLANVATATFKARSTAGTGSPEDLTITQAKTLLAIAAGDVSGLATIATSGSATDLSTGTLPAARMVALTGDITNTVGTVATTIASGVVTNAKLATAPANTMKGNNTGITASVLDLTTTQVKTLLAIAAGDVSGLATIATSGSAADLSTGTIPDARMPDLTGDITTSVGAVATTITANSVSNTKLADMGANTVKGAISAGDPADLTTTQLTTLINTFTSVLSGAVPASGGSASNFLNGAGAWTIPAGAGDVAGPGSATDNAIVRFDLATGKIIQNSSVTITDAGEVLSVAGTNLLPSYAFAADPDTGIYNISANTIGISTFGTLRFDISTTAITSTLPHLNGGGGASVPSYSFSADPNTGMFNFGADQLGFATGATLRQLITTTYNYSSVPYQSAAGTVGAPQYSFNGDTDTGIYRITTDNIGIATTGVLRFDVSTAAITSTLPHLNGNGSAGAPSYSFSGDPNTGMYNFGADQLGFTTGGVLKQLITTTYNYSGLPYQGVSGTVGAPQYSFNGDTTTGIYRIAAGNVGVATSGVLRLDVSATAVTSTLPIVGPAGAAATPTYTFTGDTTTGLYSAAASTIGISTAATVRFSIDTLALTGVTAGSPYLKSNWSLSSAPAYSFNSDTDTGMYSGTANTIGFTTSGTPRVTIDTTEVTSTLPLRVAAASAAAPAYSFGTAADNNTGIYRVAEDQLGVATGGTLRFDVSTTAVTSTLQILAPAGASGTPSHSFSTSTQSGIWVDTNYLHLATKNVEMMRLGLGVIESGPGTTGSFSIKTAAGSSALPTYSFTGDTATGMYNSAASTIDFINNTSLGLSINTTNVECYRHLQMVSKNVVPSAGFGVDFTSNGGSLLDQYEEGTWTPVVHGTTVTGSYTYSTQVGTYRRIGDTVHFWGILDVSAVTTGSTGSLQVRGLPYNPVSSNSTTFQFTDSRGTTGVTASLNGNIQGTPYMQIWRDCSASNSFTDANLSPSNGSGIIWRFAGSYLT